MLKPEQICQINFMHWMKENYPDEEKNTYHFANERKCSIQQGKLLKSMGVKRGVSDIFIPISRHGKNGLWIEIKIGKNKIIKEQKEFLELQLKNNFAAAICWGLDSIKYVVTNYLSLNNIRFDDVVYQN